MGIAIYGPLGPPLSLYEQPTMPGSLAPPGYSPFSPPMMPGSFAPPPAAPTTQPRPTFNSFLTDNRNALMQGGLALLGHRQNAAQTSLADVGQAMAGGMAFDAVGREKREAEEEADKKKTATIDWLERVVGMSPEDAQATADAGLVGEVMKMVGKDGDDGYGLQPIYGTDAEGNPIIMQLGKNGQAIRTQMPEGFTLSTGTDKVDLGTAWGIVDRRRGVVIGVVPKDVKGEAAATAEGRVVGERAGNAPKAATALRDLESQWDLVDRSIEEALADTSWLTAGPMSLTDAIPGTPAFELKELVKTIEANIGFDKLQAMRDASPTGGALGQVSDFENRLLQAVRGSLARGQRPETLRRRLMEIQQDLRALREDRRRAFAMTYGEGALSGGGMPEGTGGGGMGAPASPDDPLGIR